jgi:hypothetical protein
MGLHNIKATTLFSSNIMGGQKKKTTTLSFFISFLETPTNKLCLEGVTQPHYYYFLLLKKPNFH